MSQDIRSDDLGSKRSGSEGGCGLGHIVVSRQSSVGSRRLPSVECCKEEAAEVLTTEDYGLAAEKGGWNGPLGPFPRDEEEGGKDGRLQRKRWSERLVRPTEQGTQGFFRTSRSSPSSNAPTVAKYRSGEYGRCALRHTTSSIRGLGRKPLPIFAADLPSSKTMSAVKSYLPSKREEPTP